MLHAQTATTLPESSASSPGERAEPSTVPSGLIRPVERERRTDRREVRLPTVWVCDGDVPPAAPRRDATWLTGDVAADWVTDRAAALLVALHAADSPAWSTLLAHAEAGGRAYVLAPVDLPRGETRERLAACPQVLIRRVSEVFASAALADGQGHVWLGAVAGGRAPWRLRLDGAQAAALRQVFLRVFWHEAVDEAFSGGERFDFEPAAPRPFDVPALRSDAPVTLAAPTAQLAVARDGRAHLQGGEPPTVAPRRLWWPAGAEQHPSLATLRRAGAEVVSGALGLPDLVVDGAAGVALLPGASARLRVVLHAGQAAELAALLDGPAPWRFEVDARLGAFAPGGPSLWLAGAPEASPTRADELVAAPKVAAETVREALAATPEVWPAPHPLTLVAHHRWTARPPAVPSGAGEDGLVDRWRQVDRGFESRLAALRGELTATEAHQGRLGKLTRLVSALTGFGRTQRRLAEEVERLAATPPSRAGVDGAPGRLAALTELEAQVKRLVGDLGEAERKAREDEERQRQEAAWGRKVDEAQRGLPRVRDELAAARARRDEVLAELDALAEADGSEGATRDEGRRPKARKAQRSDEAKRLDKKIPQLEAESARLAELVASTFVFQPKPAAALLPTRRKGAAFVPTPAPTAASVALPDEDLPAVGALRRHAKQRYLVITHWEELERGEREASRLDARLVAEESS